MAQENAVYDEEDLKKAEEFKDKGNEYFKGRLPDLIVFNILTFSKLIRKVDRHVHRSNLL